MVVWIVNPFDNLPMEGNRAQRYWLMAEAFIRAGNSVVYWTSDFSHATKKCRHCENRVLAEGNIKVVMLPTIPYKRNISARRILSHWRLACAFRRSAHAYLKDGIVPDVVISSMPPIGLCNMARKIAGEMRTLFVADIQDAWPETFERILPRWMLWPMRRIVREIYSESDGVSAVAMKYIDLAIKYGTKVPIKLTGHSISSRTLPKRTQDAAFKLVYIGNMGKSYDIKTLIDAVEQSDGVILDIAGTERKAGGAKVVYHGYLGEDDLADLLARADAGIVPMFPDSEVGVPGKLADYAMAGLRVIESLGGETSDILERHNAGVHYDAGNLRSMLSAIETLKRTRFAEWDKDGFAEEFRAEPIMDDYVRWIGDLIRMKNDWGSTQGPHSDILRRG